jgi:hypothetical protein
MRELANHKSPNHNGLPEAAPLTKHSMLHTADAVRRTPKHREFTLFSDRNCALFDSVKKFGFIDLSNQHFFTGDFGDDQIEDVVVGKLWDILGRSNWTVKLVKYRQCSAGEW